MSINVISTSIEQPTEKPIEQKEVKAAPVVDETSEQNQSSESETEEKEELDESKEAEESEEDSEESDDSEKEKPKKKGGFQRRIDKLNARHAQAQQEADYWKSMALKKDAVETKKESVEPVQKVNASDKPDPENFDSHSDYVEALTDWKIEQREKASKEEAQKSQLQIEQEKVLKSHSERVNAFSEKVDDFYDVLESVDDIAVSPTVREIIISSDNGAELMYELAKNKKEYARICALPPLAAARELGRIETRLDSKSSEDKKTEIKKITKAPQPIAPVGSKGGVISKSIDDPNLSQSEYEALRRKQMRAKQ